MDHKFLFELGVEEIPADLISPALEQLRSGFEGVLTESSVSWSSMATYSSPRRLAILIEGLPEQQPTREEQVVGPPASRGLDSEGQPSQAAKGFARSQGIDVNRLESIETERGLYLGFNRQVEGQAVRDILGNNLEAMVRSLSWPRSMYWTESRFRFIRPLRWYVALWDQTVVPFELEGLRAGNLTRGHRFLGKQAIPIASADQYLERLREGFVLVDAREREERVLKELESQVPDGLSVLEDAALLRTITQLNEYPSVLCGRFDETFLEIPKEVLVTVMRYHQKYFSVVNEAGEIQPCFLTVVNTSGDPEGRIRQGHERVLKARLEDAAFFWESDQKEPLQERAEQLDQVLFQEGLGSYKDKAQRLRTLCAQLHPDSDLETAAWLCKADLTTEMVRELSELQGIMGGLYARREGHPEEVWKPILEQYRPASLEDDPPSTLGGAVLSLADKLDTVVGCFSVDIVPKGSGDPFGLRRQALGLVKILFDFKLDYSLEQLVDTALKLFVSEKPAEKTRKEVLSFLVQRVRYVFQNKGLPYDVMNAVLAVEGDTVYRTYERAIALSGIRGETDFEALAAAYKRIKNILAQEIEDPGEVSVANLSEPEEIELYQTFERVQPRVLDFVSRGDFVAALKEMASMRATVDLFFDRVLVMAEEEELRKNRLRLLRRISDLLSSMADISEIVQKARIDPAGS